MRAARRGKERISSSCILRHCLHCRTRIVRRRSCFMSRRTLRDWGLLLALAAFWGSNFMFVKLGVSAVPPATLVAARLAIGAVILVAVVRAWGYTFPPLGRAWLPYAVIALGGNGLPFWVIP